MGGNEQVEKRLPQDLLPIGLIHHQENVRVEIIIGLIPSFLFGAASFLRSTTIVRDHQRPGSPRARAAASHPYQLLLSLAVHVAVAVTRLDVLAAALTSFVGSVVLA